MSKRMQKTIIRVASAFTAFTLILPANVLLLLPQTAYAATTLFSDSFGTTDSNTVADWVEEEDGSSDARVTDNNPRGASPTDGHVRLRDDASITRSFDTEGYEDINLSFYRRRDNDAEVNQSDDLVVSWREGTTGTFNELWSENIACGGAGCNWLGDQVVISLPDDAEDTLIQIRFRATTSSDEEEARIDDVEVIGTALPVDSDNDGVADEEDNCPNVSNPQQEDTDGDGFGDACDETPNGDTDEDGVDNETDNCPDVANSGQEDNDGDGAGDACDVDDDNDGYSDTEENEAGSDPFDPNSTPEICDGVDNDLDLSVDEGFADTDEDGTADCVDPTPNGSPTIEVYKWEDLDSEGDWDENEQPVEGWTMGLGKFIPDENPEDQQIPIEIVALSLTGNNGLASLPVPENEPGQYRIFEASRDGWVTTNPQPQHIDSFFDITYRIDIPEPQPQWVVDSFFDIFVDIDGNVQITANNQSIEIPQFGNWQPPLPECPEGWTGIWPICFPPPIDVCPNLDDNQTTVPEGFELVEGMCVEIQEPIDVCPNLDGLQTVVPNGYELVEGQCVLIPPPPPPPSGGPTAQSFPQCIDNLDNDGDGKVDLQDSGCDSSSDNDETDPVLIPPAVPPAEPPSPPTAPPTEPPSENPTAENPPAENPSVTVPPPPGPVPPPPAPQPPAPQGEVLGFSTETPEVTLPTPAEEPNTEETAPVVDEPADEQNPFLAAINSLMPWGLGLPFLLLLLFLFLLWRSKKASEKAS